MQAFKPVQKFGTSHQPCAQSPNHEHTSHAAAAIDPTSHQSHPAAPPWLLWSDASKQCPSSGSCAGARTRRSPPRRASGSGPRRASAPPRRSRAAQQTPEARGARLGPWPAEAGGTAAPGAAHKNVALIGGSSRNTCHVQLPGSSRRTASAQENHGKSTTQTPCWAA